MLSLEEISDRLEIQQLLVDYSTAIDQRRFDDLDKVFTPDAYIESRAPGRGPARHTRTAGVCRRRRAKTRRQYRV
ncbi:MAG TPA: nuclear transport factor 2 family protein, partial [Mycobacterium sp.]